MPFFLEKSCHEILAELDVAERSSLLSFFAICLEERGGPAKLRYLSYGHKMTAHPSCREEEGGLLVIPSDYPYINGQEEETLVSRRRTAGYSHRQTKRSIGEGKPPFTLFSGTLQGGTERGEKQSLPCCRRCDKDGALIFTLSIFPFPFLRFCSSDPCTGQKGNGGENWERKR